MSVDIPSGICATTGNVLGTAVRADYTVTIQETKVGLVLDPGRSYAGICVSEDIGIVSLPLERDEETVCTLEGSDYAALLPKRNADSNKGTLRKASYDHRKQKVCQVLHILAHLQLTGQVLGWCRSILLKRIS